MIIDLDDEQKKLMLETLGIAHQIEYLKGKDNSKLEKLIKKFCQSLKDEDKQHIFYSVFQEMDE